MALHSADLDLCASSFSGDRLASRFRLRAVGGCVEYPLLSRRRPSGMLFDADVVFAPVLSWISDDVEYMLRSFHCGKVKG